MTVSIRKMSLGAGYRYLMSSVARGDVTGPVGTPLTRYYAASGTPPGRFLGAGLAGLCGGVGVRPGTEVSEEHLFRMLGMLQDPLTGAPLGRAPRRAGKVRVGGAGQMRAPGRPVAGFDLTFSAPKSVSVAWGLGDPATQAVVYEAHLRAVQHVISYAEGAGIFSSRSGNAGVLHEEVRGVVAAGFDHWDSRTGDPQLHTHVVVMNRAQCADGTWRTLDGRVLFAGTVALSELYNGVLSDYLTQALRWGWEPVTRAHSPVPKYEVAGVSPALQTEFSRRSGAIEGAKDALVESFVAAHGYQPSARQVLKLRQQATLATRPNKQHHQLAEQMDGWRARAAGHLDGADPSEWVTGLEERNILPLLTSTSLDDATLDDVAAVAVRVVAGQRATFTRLNVQAEVTRQLHGARFTDPAERVSAIDRATGMALGQVVPISAPELAHTPALLRRQDGSSRFRFPHLETYTTRATLDAEARLVDAGRCQEGPAVPASAAAELLAPPPTGLGSGDPAVDAGLPAEAATVSAGTAGLSVEQARVVGDVVASGRVLDVLVGAAGTGKSTTMAGLRYVWEAHHGPGSVVGLAPSAAAAEVLSEAVRIPTENTVKWLTEHTRNPERYEQIRALQAKLWRASPSLATRLRRGRLAALIQEYRAWSLSPGQLLILDEASMAGTAELDAITAHARRATAKVLLVGDPAQLSPVRAGGAFALLVHDRGDDAPRLAEVHRFTQPWERAASLRLRNGDIDAVDVYTTAGRVTGGEREAMLDALFAGWRADVAVGRRSLMIADDNSTVAELNARAQAEHRVASSHPAQGGSELADGSTATVGDLVVTRRNDRTLATGKGWVKNGDTWTVAVIDSDGAVTVQRTGHGGMATLPAEYVREHVELGYATTAHRAQGRTVDTAHAYITAETRREPLYVMATRGRDANRLYVQTTEDADPETAHLATGDDWCDPAAVLRQAVATSGVEKAATQSIADDWTDAHSVARQSAEYVTIARTAERHDNIADPDVDRALAERAELIRQAATGRRRRPSVPEHRAPTYRPSSRQTTGPEL